MRRFRLPRRLTAFAVQLLLLQFIFASGAGACPLENRDAPATAGMQMGDVVASHDLHRAEPVEPPTHQPATPASHHHPAAHCNMTCAPVSCEAAGHCLTPATLTEIASDPTGAMTHALTPTSVSTAPHPVSTAPEPPPPRARTFPAI